MCIDREMWEVVGSPPFVDPLLVFVLWHCGVTAVILWMYWWKGRPSHLGQHAGASISVGSAVPQVVALSAVFSAALGPLAYLMHSVWFALNLSFHTTGGERLATGIPLALGHAGVGGIWLGAIVAHAAIVGWCVRAVVTAAVERNKSGLVLCASCSYALKENHVGVCPECGVEHKCTPTRFHLMTDWLCLRTSVVWAAVILLYCAPITLSMLGRITPQQLAEPIAHWWYGLF